jgi:antitoxin (DNA-binding transcriptional repressor) of toxin-antitoxin stability system
MDQRWVEGVRFPYVVRLVQRPQQPVVKDPAGEVRRQLRASSLVRVLKPGDRVAIAVGSRGIANLVPIVRAVVEELQALGGRPFVVAAMGSHGGATPSGQRQLLADYGITEAALGVPILTEMDVVLLGRSDQGFPVYWDRRAYEADAVVAVARVKPHTDFRGRYESGVVKMLVVGLGKKEGATEVHRLGARGLREVLPAAARVVLERTPFALAVAVVENAYDQTAFVRVLERYEVLDEEPLLLEQARAWMAKLPFEELDVLVVGEMGKNYSGAGLDPNVIGRLMIAGEPEFDRPRIRRIVVLDLAPESHGNAIGIGLADFTTERLLRAIDREPFLVNAMVSTFVERARVPLAFSNDREAIAAALQTCWQPEVEQVRLAVIPNTLELSVIWASPAACAGGLPDHVSMEGDPRPLPFDAGANLMQEELFPDSWRARRRRGLLCTLGR